MEKLQTIIEAWHFEKVILAAAVSDFYIPFEKMAVHKIDSANGLELKLENVPKMLGKIKEWDKNT